MPQALARLVIGASELDADLFYLTNFRAPDPFIYLESEGRTTLLMSDLEVDRAKAHARVDEILSLSHYQEKAKQKNDNGVPSSLQALHTLLQERRITKLEVPATFAIEAGDYLRGEGYTVTFPSGAFVGSRACKSEDEVARIREVQQATELAMGVAIEAVRNADVSNGMLLEAGHPLTAEAIKKRIALLLMDEGCTAKNTIVACGDQACDPHNEGTGPLEAGMPIVIDIFPRSDISGYYADITRTVIKGEPTDEQSKLYATVEAGHSLVLERIVAGADGMDIHAAVLELFESAGYRTGEIDGRMQGFFHGTGHGLGLEIHEPPRISRSSQKLIEGHVVTVEPGLYYPGLGGVRIEDLVVVRSDGCENLTTYPKVFQV